MWIWYRIVNKPYAINKKPMLMQITTQGLELRKLKVRQELSKYQSYLTIVLRMSIYCFLVWLSLSTCNKVGVITFQKDTLPTIIYKIIKIETLLQVKLRQSIQAKINMWKVGRVKRCNSRDNSKRVCNCKFENG